MRGSLSRGIFRARESMSLFCLILNTKAFLIKIKEKEMEYILLWMVVNMKVSLKMTCPMERARFSIVIMMSIRVSLKRENDRALDSTDSRVAPIIVANGRTIREMDLVKWYSGMVISTRDNGPMD